MPSPEASRLKKNENLLPSVAALAQAKPAPVHNALHPLRSPGCANEFFSVVALYLYPINDRVNAQFEPRPSCIWGGGLGLWPHHAGLARLQRLPLRYIVYAAAAALILGGAAIQFRRTAKTGAVVLVATYLVFVLLCVSPIVAAPQIYNSWGNFFEQFSLVTGAAIVYARLSSACSPVTLNRISRILLGICAASFALEQAIYLDATTHLVPKWIPPSQMFWAVATTVWFALAAVALLTNRMALLASRLLTMMVVSFGLLVWVPLLLSAPHNHTNWRLAERHGFSLISSASIGSMIIAHDNVRCAGSRELVHSRHSPD